VPRRVSLREVSKSRAEEFLFFRFSISAPVGFTHYRIEHEDFLDCPLPRRRDGYGARQAHYLQKKRGQRVRARWAKSMRDP